MKHQIITATLGLFTVLGTTAKAAPEQSCAAYTLSDLGGDKVTEPDALLTTMPAKNGSVFIASGYGVSIYPGNRYVGPATIVDLNTYPGTFLDQYAYLLKPTANGHYINLVDLYDASQLAFFPNAGIGSFHCFKDGITGDAGKLFPVHVFYNDQTFLNPAINPHGSDKTVTLTNLNKQKLLTYSLKDPDEGSFSLVLDLDTGSLTFDQPSEHGMPAVHTVKMPSDGAAFNSSLADLASKLSTDFGAQVAGSYPYLAPTEALLEIRNNLTIYLNAQKAN